jgi:hypothetical protein
MVRAMTDRTTGRLVGGLFIAATLAGVLALVLHEPVGDIHDYLISVGGNVGRGATTALLELIMGIAVAAIAVAIYPILARSSARMALGYVIARAAEGLLIVIGTVGSLTILTTGRAYVEAHASDASLLALGDALVAERASVWGAIQPIAFALSAVILNVVLYRARLVPRWLSLWGLFGGALWVVACVLVIYGLDSSSVTPMAAPIALQEMVFAVYLIVRGFRSSGSVPPPRAARMAGPVISPVSNTSPIST